MSDSSPWWQYRGQLVRVVDGDTLDLLLDMGFKTHRQLRVRLSNVDTSEVYGVAKDSEEYEEGMEHSAFVSDWLQTAQQEFAGPWPLVVTTEKDEKGKYGRYLARVQRRSDDRWLDESLVTEFPSVEVE